MEKIKDDDLEDRVKNIENDLKEFKQSLEKLDSDFYFFISDLNMITQRMR